MTKLQQTMGAAIFAAIAPALIMLLIGSLIWFCAEIVYYGQYLERMRLILALWVFGSVLVCRIAVTEGKERSVVFGLALAAVVWIAMMQFVEVRGALASFEFLMHIMFIMTSWWCASKLVWDCTVVDSSRDTTSQGLLRRVRFDRMFSNSDDAENESAETSDDEIFGATGGEPVAKPNLFQQIVRMGRKQNTPGLTVVYFSLAAIPIFGFGQGMISADNEASRQFAFQMFVCYMSAALGLLLTTSLLSLQQYLHKRDVAMPNPVALTWVATGLVAILVILTAAWILPRPYPEYSLGESPILFESPKDLQSSKYAMFGNDGPDDQESDRVNQDRDKTGSQVSKDGKEKSNQGNNPESKNETGGGKSEGKSKSESGKSKSKQQNKGKSESKSKESKSGSKSEDEKGKQGTKRSEQNDSGKQGKNDKGEKSQSSDGDKSKQQDKNQSQPEKSDKQDSGSKSDEGSKKDEGSKQQSRENDDSKASETDKNSDSDQSDEEKSQDKSQRDDSDDKQSDDSQKQSDERSKQEAEQQSDRQDEREKSQRESKRQEPRQQMRLNPTVGSFITIIKWLFYFLVAIAALFFGWKYRRRIAQAWKEFVDEVKLFFARLFGGKKRDQLSVGEEIIESAKSHCSFHEFSDPFTSGRSRQMTSEELARYCFAAFQAWAADNGVPREPDQTPNEFAQLIGDRQRRIKREAKSIGEIYSAAVYSNSRLARNVDEKLEHIWRLLQTTDIPPLPETADPLTGNSVVIG